VQTQERGKEKKGKTLLKPTPIIFTISSSSRRGKKKKREGKGKSYGPGPSSSSIFSPASLGGGGERGTVKVTSYELNSAATT